MVGILDRWVGEPAGRTGPRSDAYYEQTQPFWSVFLPPTRKGTDEYPRRC